MEKKILGLVLTLLVLAAGCTQPKNHLGGEEKPEQQTPQTPESVEKGNLVIEGISEIPKRIEERMLQYQNTRSAYIYDWLPSGEGMLISTRFGETRQVHWVKKPGGARHQITFFKEPVSGAAVCPDKDKNGFLFIKDVGGGENYQIFFFDLGSGKYEMLTDGSGRNTLGLWSNRGDRFVYSSTKRNGRDWDIYVADLENPGKPTLLLQVEGYWRAVDWSPDDRKLLVLNYVSANESYYYILDLESGELEQINPNKEKISYWGARWSKDGRGVYLVSDEESEFHQLKYYDLERKEFTVLTGHIPWDVDEFELSPKGDLIAFVTNEDGISKLHLMDTKTREELGTPELPVGQVYGLEFSPDGEKLAMVINTPQTPGDIYVLNIKTNSLERWTYSEVGGLKTEDFVTPKLIHYPTFDMVGDKPRMIPAFYYKPDKGEPPYPVLIYIHGGPESQYVPYFWPTIQFYVKELGIAVIAPNVRGSSGYGKSYLKLDNGYKREDAVKDIGKLLDWIEQQPELDSERVAVMGGSYGGYMVLASMIHYNDRLRAGIEICGISNFVTFLENTEDYRKDLRRVEYGDERDPEMREFLERISPTTNAHKITKPMFIAQGLNDPRVPVSEAEQIVGAIRENGGVVWYLLAKDEGHGFRKKSNRDYYNNAVVLFLEEYLLK
ncbi:MAG: S9 family peptidase [Methanobacteriota archaeon]|nr:MAG: S9 family peptidase [Euryarchaeota archaeon]